MESSPTSSGASSTSDPYAQAWERVERAVLCSDGAHEIARGDDPPELATLLDKVRRHAYRVSDSDVEGLDVDVVVESVLAAALGEGDRRRRAALEAIG